MTNRTRVGYQMEIAVKRSPVSVCSSCERKLRFGLPRLLSALTIACGIASPAAAKDPEASIRLELNRLEPQGENCRAYLLVKNESSDGLKSLKADLFAFDSEGVAQKRIAVELGPIPKRKTRVKLFDFPGLACSGIGSVLLNDVLACEGHSGAREDCLDSIETSSKRGAVALTK